MPIPCLCVCVCVCVCVSFLGPHPWHMEVPRLGVKWELQLPAYVTAPAKQVCNLHHISQQCWILNPLSKDRDRTRVLMDTSWVHYPWAMMGTPNLEHFTFTLSYGPLPANLWAGNFHLHFIDESIIYFYVPICSEPNSDSDIFLVS